MTPRQIENKINELDFWLIHNPTHPDYTTLLKDKRKLEQKRVYKYD